jgi:hypothetical protein
VLVAEGFEGEEDGEDNEFDPSAAEVTEDAPVPLSDVRPLVVLEIGAVPAPVGAVDTEEAVVDTPDAAVDGTISPGPELELGFVTALLHC